MAQEKNTFVYPETVRPDCDDTRKLVNLDTLAHFGKKILGISEENDRIIEESLDAFASKTEKKIGELPPAVDRYGNILKDKQGNYIPVAGSLVEYVDMCDRRTYDEIHSEVISQKEIEKMFPANFIASLKENK